MFRHVSLLRWKDGTDGAAVEAVLRELRTLPGGIPALRNYVLGSDAGIDAGNYDLAIVADFDDEAGYLVYRDHPVHRTIIESHIRPILADRAAVQHSL